MALTPAQIVNTLAPIVGRVGAAGIAGNLMQESSDRPGAPGGGLAQWQGSRYGGLVKYAQTRGLPATSAQAALGYLAQDLKGPYSSLTAQLRQAKDPGSAATLFSNIYERPGTPMLGNRINYARQALGGKSAGGGGGGGGLGGAFSQTGAFAQPQGPRSISTTVPTFDQTGFNDAKARYIAGSFVSKASPWNVGPQGANLGPNPLLSSGVLTRKAPDPADFQGTKTIRQSLQGAQAVLQKIAGETPLKTHPGAVIPALKMPKGVAQYGGKPVAAWIAPILAYARQHGWRGTVTSGYRSLGQQTAIYNSGVRPAAKPGQSNHEMTAFPGGAVDVSDAQQLSAILLRSPYARALVYAGSKDPVHFSHPHNGSY